MTRMAARLDAVGRILRRTEVAFLVVLGGFVVSLLSIAGDSVPESGFMAVMATVAVVCAFQAGARHAKRVEEESV